MFKKYKFRLNFKINTLLHICMGKSKHLEFKGGRDAKRF